VRVLARFRISADLKEISRRSFILGTATACGALLAGCNSSREHSDPRQLNVYSWADYIHPDTVPEFEHRFGINVVYDTFSSNEALLAKMQAGATAYDIIVPSSYMVAQLRKLNVLAPIDHSRLPLLKNIMPRFQSPAYDPRLGYCVPYTWGTSGIGFNSSAFASKRDWPTDWDSFWDKKLAGRMTLLDDPREAMGMALKRRGHSYNTHNTAAIQTAANDLIAQKPYIMCYTSDQDIIQLAAGDSLLAQAYSGDVYQAARSNPSIRYIIPRSGASLWVDNMCIPSTAPHIDNAYKWLNFILEPKIAAANARFTRYATPNQLAFDLVGDDLRTDANLYPSEQLLSKCDELGDVGKLIFLYDKLWTELKCT